jgi:hypothetical protein
MSLSSASSDSSFKNWVFNDRPNRMLLLISAAVILIEWIIFKRLFPFPNFIPESTNYIDCALNNKSISVWPIAYSKFLRVFNTFVSSDTGLVTFQYLFLQGSIIYFLLSISWLLKLPRPAIIVLFILNLLNPILLHLANYVSSDAIFVGLSLIWFTQMLWLIRRLTLATLCLHAIVLFLAFSLRFFAIYYPVVSIILLLLLHTKPKVKIIGAAVIIIPLVLYVIHETREYQVETKTTQFSAFGGWQLSANALYAYAHSPLDSPALAPPPFRALHALVNRHMIELSHLQHRPDQQINIYYQWDDQAPLKRYMYQYWLHDSTTDNFTKYAVMGKLYSGYGAWLIRRHPFNYVLYFGLPNSVDYYAPEPEFMGAYNMGFDSVAPVIANWFGWRSRKVENAFKTNTIHLAGAYTIIVPVINLIFIFTLLVVLFSKGYMDGIPLLKPLLRITLVLWAVNMLFSVFSAWIILRYAIFPLIMTVSFAIVCISFLIREFQFENTFKKQTILYE